LTDWRQIPHCWSASQSAMLGQCERKYFLHYNFARGGHDQNAPPAVRQVHLLKSLMTVDQYLFQLKTAALRRFFYLRDPWQAWALRKLEADLLGCLDQRYLADHRALGLSEWFYRQMPWDELHRTLQQRLKHDLTVMAEQLLPALVKVRPEQKLEIPEVVSVSVNGVDCYFAGGIAFHREGGVCWVSLRDDRFESTLHKFYAAHCWHLFPDKVESLTFGETLMPATVDISGTLNRILADGRTVNELRAKLPEALTQNLAHCQFCQFRQYCR